jgi:hypothetical protein
LFQFSQCRPVLMGFKVLFFLLCHLIHFFFVSFYVLFFIFFLLSSPYFSQPPILPLSLLSSSSLPTVFSSYFQFPSLLLLLLSFLVSSSYFLGLRIIHNIFLYTGTILGYTTISPCMILHVT